MRRGRNVKFADVQTGVSEPGSMLDRLNELEQTGRVNESEVAQRISRDLTAIADPYTSAIAKAYGVIVKEIPDLRRNTGFQREWGKVLDWASKADREG